MKSRGNEIIYYDVTNCCVTTKEKYEEHLEEYDSDVWLIIPNVTFKDKQEAEEILEILMTSLCDNDLNKTVVASLNPKSPWVDEVDGGYLEVWNTNGLCYLDGEVCKIIGFDNKAREIGLRNEDNETNSDFIISYDQFYSDFSRTIA